MAKKNTIEALDTLLKDLMNTKHFLVEKLLFLGETLDKHFLLFVMGKKEDFIIKVYYTLIFGIISKNCAYLKTCV
uniref:Putative ovule protein n=1 Tax=Solanum chacoense TaxID=4108 RepID=A0A0V0HHJ7_SOLCH